MQFTKRLAVAAGAAVLLLVPALAGGGFWIQLGNPDASPEARALKAILTFTPTGCGNPQNAEVSAFAVGLVNGKTTTIPLKIRKLSQPGHYAVTKEWPDSGRWLIRITANDQNRVTSALVPVGPNGPDRSAARFLPRQVADDDLKPLLAMN